MIEIAYLCVFAIIITFFYNLQLLFFNKPKNNVEEVSTKWKKSLIVFFIALFLFFIYYGTTFNTFQQSTTITNGGDTYTVKNNDYLDALTFFPIVLYLLPINFGLLVANVLIDFNVFTSRGRMKKKQKTIYQNF